MIFFDFIASISLDSFNEEYENFCCYGYCIDLLKELSENLTFVYTLHLVGDNKYGSYEKVIERKTTIIFFR